MRVKYPPWYLGKFYRADDRTGFKVDARDTRKEWNGLVVRKESWEARHPQDFVRGVADEQSVHDARPGSNVYLWQETTLDADEAQGQTTLSVASTAGMSAGVVVQISMDNDELHLGTVVSIVAGDTVTIGTALPFKASSGKAVRIVGTGSL